MANTLSRGVVAEALGTGLLVAAVVGSGIMGERLAGGNVAIALLANTLATGAALLALILTFGPVSGAHFNPVVTLSEACQGALPRAHALLYIAAQIPGALAGVAIANVMFAEPLFAWSERARHGGPQLLSEIVATFGLLTVILGCKRHRPQATAGAVASYITAAYWFTASTSFANPAVTVARCLTNTFAGIRPADVPGFIAAQIVGGGAALVLMRWLMASVSTSQQARVGGS